jgi:uncharacterized protein (DUF427 family)
MPTAAWNNRVIAQSDRLETMDGNAYLPAAAVAAEYLRASETTSACSWKSVANYYSLAVDGNEHTDAAWVYRDPSPAAARIKGMSAVWRGIEVKP